MNVAMTMEGVEKRYRHFSLGPVDLELPRGSVLGLIGPNGAGKSTLMRLLTGIVRADAGEIDVLGYRIPGEQVAAKMQVGYMAEDLRLYEQTTIGWHLDFVSGIYPSWDGEYAAHLLDRFDLRASQRVKGLSHGERIKSGLILVLARRPRLLLLDEPTTGLDPVVRHEVLAELMELLVDGERSVVFSSHNTQDVEQISDQIAFVDRGRLVDLDDKESFLEKWSRLRCEVAAETRLPELPGVWWERDSGSLRVAVTCRDHADLRELLHSVGGRLRSAEPMTLEEIFLANVRLSRSRPAEPLPGPRRLDRGAA